MLFLKKNTTSYPSRQDEEQVKSCECILRRGFALLFHCLCFLIFFVSSFENRKREMFIEKSVKNVVSLSKRNAFIMQS
jgi:hypothetical protein